MEEKRIDISYRIRSSTVTAGKKTATDKPQDGACAAENDNAPTAALESQTEMSVRHANEQISIGVALDSDREETSKGQDDEGC